MTIVLLVYLGFGLFLFLAQRSFIYFPVAERLADDLPVEYLVSGGESLKLWVVNPGREAAAVYFGGNAEDVYLNAAQFRDTLPGHTVYLVNYRGYGGSGGSPTEAHLFADALAVFDVLAERHSHIAAIGRSLGSSVAVFLAAQRPVHRLVLVTPHDSALALAQRMYPVYPVSLLLKDRYDSTRYAPRVNAATLLIMAGRDRLIPRVHSNRLAAAFAPGLASEVVVAHAGHNDISQYREYWTAIARFLE